MRKNLRSAREVADLSQKELADLIGAEEKAVIAWEKGTRLPQPAYRRRVRDVLHNTDPDLFKNAEGEETSAQESEHDEVRDERRDSPPLALPQPDTGLSVQPPCHSETNRGILDSSDSTVSIPESVRGFSFMDKLRRAISNAVGATLVGVNLQVILAPPVDAARTTSSVVIDPEEYLDESTTIVKECWQLVNTWQFDRAKALLNADKRILSRLAATPFPHQGLAANLAFESEIMQIIMETHELDYVARENHCAQAVRFGRLSDNWNMFTIALDWQANTYIYCYHQPQNAIRILSNALSGLNSDISPLSRSETYIQLAMAYAQDGNETKAETYVELARETMPSLPELDPFYRYILVGHSELDEFEGRMHLYLPGSRHAQMALDALEQSISKQPSQGNLGKALTRKADAARALGDMRTFVKSLEQGLHIAIEIDSKKQISEASEVISRIPAKWQGEPLIQPLRKDIVAAQRKLITLA